MEHRNQHGILMRGVGRWFVYGRARAGLGMTFEIPDLLRHVDLTREELSRMLQEAGLETVSSRVSLGRVKAIAHKRNGVTAR